MSLELELCCCEGFVNMITLLQCINLIMSDRPSCLTCLRVKHEATGAEWADEQRTEQTLLSLSCLSTEQLGKGLHSASLHMPASLHRLLFLLLFPLASQTQPVTPRWLHMHACCIFFMAGFCLALFNLVAVKAGGGRPADSQSPLCRVGRVLGRPLNLSMYHWSMWEAAQEHEVSGVGRWDTQHTSF